MAINKVALELTSVTDPRTNLEINVSTAVRKKYREYYSGQEVSAHTRADYSNMSNVELNEIIAQDFAASASNAKHMFLARTSSLETRKREWIEIRKVGVIRPFNFFFSVIRKNSIDIIAISTIYKKPRKARAPITDVTAG